jgi:hypothetical protein
MFNIKIGLNFNKKIILDNEESIETKISLLKKKQNEYLNSNENTDYSRTLFLYEKGFIKMKRVMDFTETMKTIGNIKEYKKIEEKYTKFEMLLLNTEMLKSIEIQFSLKKTIHTLYNGVFSNNTIDILKKNYDKIGIDDYYILYNIYKKYHKSSAYQEVKDIANNRVFLMSPSVQTIIRRGELEDIYNQAYYWKLSPKNFFIYYNNKKGMIVVEAEEGYYLVLAEWTDTEKDNTFINKMNFRDFIKSNNILKYEK